MILFTIMLGVIITIAVIGLLAAIIAGGSLIAVFGDVIVFGLIVWLIIKIFRRKKKGSKEEICNRVSFFVPPHSSAGSRH